MDTIARIEAKLDKSGDCWLWLGGKTKRGYGIIHAYGKQHRVHRLFYSMLRGTPEKNLELDHLCRVRHCCNPDHLEPVSRAVNARRGSQTKLTPAAVECIRASDSSRDELAKIFGVAPETISDVRLMKSWKDIK